MRTAAAFLTLIVELQGDVTELKRLQEHNLRAWNRIRAGADDVLDWDALGFTLHTLYGVLENYFLRVSKFFENNLPADRWHRALVEKMALEIIPIRPALLTEQLKNSALAWMKFRHRMRNLYGEDLDPHKTEEIQKLATTFLEAFPDVHEQFADQLRAIAGGLS